MGELLRDMTRATDFVCRYGGDEFCVLLPGSDEPHAIAFAERVRNAAKNTPVEANGCTVTMKMTAGVAQWREDLITPRRLIDLADEALLAAKRVGRDRVLGYAQLHRISLDDAGHQKDAKQFHGVLTADVMTSPIVSVRVNQTIGEVAELFISLNTNSLPVVDDRGRLVGLISEKDVLNAVESSEEWTSPVAKFMNRRVVTFDEMDPAVDVWEFMRHVTMRRVVIVRDRLPVGVVSRGTLLRWLKNWDSVLPRRGQLQTPGARHTLSEQVGRLADGIADEATGLRQNASDTHESLVPSIVCTATRLQDKAQDLLTLSRAVQPPLPPCEGAGNSDVQPPLVPCPDLPSQPHPPTVPQ
jgi:CBS domain-containing protein